MIPFTDHCPFQGVIQYYDNEGIEWRREDADLTWKFYQEVEGNFVFCGEMRKTQRGNIYTKHKMFLEILEFGETKLKY